jgi:hypothetical protein
MVNCKHKYVFKYTDSYWSPDGRNSVKYYLVDYYFCEKCLEEKVIEKRHSCYDSQKWDAPEWTKTITKKVGGYY